MTPRRRNFLVGLVVLVAMFTLAWMILKFANQSLGQIVNKGTPFKIISDRVDGVSEGSPIYYLGVSVGRVMSVRRMEGQEQVQIDAVLDPGPPPPANLAGVIRPQSALGMSAMISLEVVGKPEGKLTDRTEPIPAKYTGGGVVPPEFGALARDIREQQLIRHVDEAVVSMRLQLEKAGQVIESINGLLGDAKTRDDIKSTVAHVRGTSENLDRFSGRLDELTRETNETLKEVRAVAADGRKNLNGFSKQLDDRMHQLGGILTRAESVATKMDQGKGTAGQLVNDPRLYESLVDTSRELGEAVKEMKLLVRQWQDEGLHLKMK